MWKRSFIATTVALGGSVDDALAAMDTPDAQASDLVDRLKTAQRATRAAAVGAAALEITKAIAEVTLA
jgi:hypothetical protein